MPAIDTPFIGATIAFLEVLVLLLKPCAPAFEPSKIAELQSYLALCVQFGRPVKSFSSNHQLLITSAISTPISIEPNSDVPPPSFLVSENDNIPKTQAGVFIKLCSVEFVSLVQSGSAAIFENIQSSGMISATVSANTSALPDITVQLNKITSSDSELVNVRFHDCVKKSRLSSQSICVTFSPISGTFPLCCYSIRAAAGATKFPAKGMYRLEKLNQTQFKILLQLKFENCALEYAHMTIPFPNQTPIAETNLTATAGITRIDKSSPNNAIQWDIDKHFKNLDATLSGTITFSEQKNTEYIFSNDGNIPCSALQANHYVKINFKALDTIFSRFSASKQIFVNQKAYSSSKHLTLSRMLVSKNYIINSS
ncbi:uncharacterized protein LOC126311207 [Schistocerca gregaria]|uniref:uncharacterized protein LOC126311207 n=1 Tax=Schistocerca gregaria TaxID=7010 RepID=UPI00211E5801|nr:uncharacterized protein LOC126311207 [Schistocerca gregaria]